jgi:hypothetical protein
MTLKSVIITLRELLCRWFNLVLYEDWDIAQCCIESLHKKCAELNNLIINYPGIVDRASEANARLQHTITFLEGRVQELEIAAAKQKIEPKKDNKVEPVLFSRSSWRAIAQQRSIASIPDTEPDSVKQLESKVAKEI